MAANDGSSGNGHDGVERSELQMAPELMLELARRTAELLVERIERLPEEGAWDGDFQRELEDRLLEDPPEEGRPPEAVMERVAREVLPFATRLDHPRCFAFVPSAPTWPGVLPTSWPPPATSMYAPGWSQAVRVNSSSSSSIGFGVGSAIRRARVAC